MSNNISVKITADVVDLQSKFGTARAELQATEVEFRKLARASAQGILDDAGKARYAQLTQTLLEQRSIVKGLSGDLAEAGFATSTFGRAAAVAGEDAAQLGINTAGAVRYTRELFDEFSSGRTRYVPSTLAELATAGFHLSPAMLAAAGGVAALAAGLGYLTYRAIETSHAIDQIHLNNLMAGNDLTRQQIQSLTDQIAQLPHVGSSAAQQLIAGLSSIHLPFDALHASARLAAETMEATGASAKQVGAEIAKSLAPNTSATEVAKRYQNDLTQAQVNAAEAADKSGNANTILAEKLRLLEAPLARARAHWAEYAHSAVLRAAEVMGAAEHVGEMGRLGGMGESITQIQATTDPLKQEAQAWTDNATAIKQYTSAVESLPTQKALVFKQTKAPRAETSDNGALAAAEEAANIKQQISEREIADASHTLDAIAAAQSRARDQELAADEQAANIKHQIAEREIQQDAQMLKRIADAHRKEAAEELAEKKAQVRKVESIEDQMLSGLISGRETFAQAERTIFQQLAAADIEAALHAATEKLIIGKEADSQRRGIEGATALKSIGADAAQAGAAAYRAMVGIPYVGPIIAPAAAAVAFAAVGAYKSLVSFDQGAFNLPQDMVANVHAGEMILPRPFAEEARQNGFLNGGGATQHHYHIHANDAASFQEMLLRNPSALAAGMRKVIRNGALA